MGYFLKLVVDLLKHWKAFKLSKAVVDEQFRASNSSSGVSDHQSVGSSPCRGVGVREQDILPLLLCPSDGIGSARM